MNFIFTWSDTSLNEPEELNHWAVQLFSTWNQAGKSCREKFQENQIQTKLFLIRAILMVKKYMHENLKHTVIKNIWPKK